MSLGSILRTAGDVGAVVGGGALTLGDAVIPGTAVAGVPLLAGGLADLGLRGSGSSKPATNNGGTSKGTSGQQLSVSQGNGQLQTNTNQDINTGYTGGGSTYNTTGSGSGSSAPKVSAADIAAYQDQLNSLQGLLSQADTSRANGINAYNQSYNNGLANLNQSQSNVMQGYNTQKQDATGDYQKTIGQINTNARNGYNGLMALLGGSGSAGTILAPFAVSQQANQQRSGAQDSFAKNLRNLDTATTQAQQDYKNKLNDLLTQKNSGIQKLISDIDAQKQQYLSQIAATQNQLNIAKGGGYTSPTATQSQIQALQQEQNNLQNTYATPTLQVDPVTGQPVDLSQYQAQAAQLADNNNNPADQSTDPAAALAALLKQNQDQNSSAYAY